MRKPYPHSVLDRSRVAQSVYHGSMLSELLVQIETARTPEELTAASAAGREWIEAHPEDEIEVRAALEQVVMLQRAADEPEVIASRLALT